MSTLTLDPRRDYPTLSLVGLAHGTSHFYHLLLPPLFPWLMPEFGLSFTQAGALMTVFFVVSGLRQALAGFAVDRFGASRVLFFGLCLLGCSALAVGSAMSYLQLIAAAALAVAVVIMLIWHLLPIILGLLAIIGFGVVIHIFSQKP